MKKIYLFISFLILYGCESNTLSVSTPSISCPSILFATDHRVFLGTLAKKITLDNIEFQAEINNAVFSDNCTVSNEVFSSKLSILFITKFVKTHSTEVLLPIYIAAIDNNKNILGIQYYMISEKDLNNNEKNDLKEKEIISEISLNFDNVNESSTIIIGFMLDEKRIKLIN